MREKMGRGAVVIGFAVLALTMISSSIHAQTGVLFVKNNNVGIGTSNPTVPLHIDATGGDDFAGMGPDPGPAAGQGFNYGYAASVGGGFFNTRSGGLTNLIFGTSNQTRIKILGTGSGFIAFGADVLAGTPLHPLHNLDNGAHLTSGGAWTNGSSREFKEQIADLSFDAAREALRDLNPVTFQYKTEPGEEYLGFIAEEVPDLVATADRKGLVSMDVVAVLTKVVQEQQAAIGELSRRLADLEDR